MTVSRKPCFLKLSDKQFRARVDEAFEHLRSCRLCGNLCKVDRLSGQTGVCGIGSETVVSSFSMHFGEEPPISASRGSACVFLTGCCLSCRFCQNYPISQFNNGNVVSSQKMAESMLSLQGKGAHNVNFVSPTHQVPQIIKAVYEARKLKLGIPIVYNTGGPLTII